MPNPSDNEQPLTDQSLVLDELDEKFAAFQAFRKNDTTESEKILSSLGAHDEVDHDIVLELSSPRPLGHPDRFPQAHSLAVRALEVLDRNGARGVQVKGLGPLNPVAGFLSQQVAHFIVRSYQASVAETMLRLYGRREANAQPGDYERVILSRARIHMTRLEPGFKRNPLGIPTFLVGGAVLSTAIQFLLSALGSALDSPVTRAVATVVFGFVMAGAAWIVLRGAAVARRRIKLATEQPLIALWETIGRCGEPPQDHSRVIAFIAVILTLIPWILVPIGLAISWLIG